MITSTEEDDWGQWSGADLAAELRDVEAERRPRLGKDYALLRAAEVIEAQVQEINDLGVVLAAYTDVYGLREDDKADGRA